MNLYDILKQKNKKQSPNAALPINFEERLREFAPPDSDDGDDEMAILKYYAGLWWNGNDATRQYVEKTLAKMGWEIGEDEGGYNNGGVFVVQPGDENGDSYESWPAEELVMDESGLLGFLQPEQPKSKKTTPLSVMRREFEKEKPTPVPNVIQNKDANEKNAREVHRKYADEGMAEGNTMVKHRIGLTVTDPNHPMVSKRDEPIQRTVRVPGDDPAKAINAAIAHYRRKGYKVHDHHYMGTVDYTVNEFAVDGGGGGNNGHWYTDGEIGDRIGDAWFEEFDVSNDMFNIDARGEKAKRALVNYANQWFDNKGYNVNVVGAENNEEDHDLKWYIVGSLDEPQVDEAAPDWLRHTAGAATGALAGVGASFPGAAIAGPVGGAVAGAYGAKAGYDLGAGAADWVYDKVTGKKIPADKAAVDEELTMKHQRDHSTQRRPDISNSLANRDFDMSEKPNVAKSADGHPTVKWRHHGHAGHTRVEPTLKPTTVDRKDARPIPSFLKKGVAEAKNLKKYVKIIKGPDAGKTGWIREIKHGAFKGAPKSYYIDLDDGGQANNLPATSLRLAKEQGVAEAIPLDKLRSTAGTVKDTVSAKLKQNGPIGREQVSVQQLATISDAALDKAYGYGRSTPGNTFGWQANLKSAAYAKKMIDKGVTDIEAISDAIHKGWNTTAQAFVQNPDQFDDTAKLQAAGKLEAKLQQRAQLMKQNYAQLPEEEKEKDRVVARALLQAIKGEQGVEEGMWDTVKQIPKKANAWLDSPIKGMNSKHAGHAVQGAMAGMTHGHAVGHAMTDAGVAEGMNMGRSECANIILHHTRNIDIDGDHAEGKLSGGALRHVLGQKSPTFDQLSNEYGGDYHDMVRHANLDDLQQIAQDFTGGIAEGGYNDYDNNRKGFGRDNADRNQERNAGLEGETNNIQISINGKPWKVIPCRGYADSKEEWSYLQNMKEWAAKKSAQTGKKWTVSLTGAPLSEDIAEHIGKVKDGYRLYSHTGKNLGTFGSKAGAEKHEREVQYFKHLGEDNLSELSNDLLGQYKKAAGISARDFDRAGKYSKADKRFKGIVKATVKQFDNDLKKHKTEDLTVKSADSTSPVGGGAFMESYIQDLKRAGYDI